MPRLLDVGMPFCAQPFITQGTAAVEHAVGAVRFEVVVGLGLLAALLIAHRQARQLIPFSLVALEVDVTGGFRCQRVMRRAGAAAQQHHQA
ncbi:hypothetical protein D3C81_1987090 [compost metagenome]